MLILGKQRAYKTTLAFGVTHVGIVVVTCIGVIAILFMHAPGAIGVVIDLIVTLKHFLLFKGLHVEFHDDAAFVKRHSFAAGPPSATRCGARTM